MLIPTQDECIRILKENDVPDNIIAHTKAVCRFALRAVDFLDKNGIPVNRDLVAAGALLHDIKKLSKNDHVVEGYTLIKSMGYDEVALTIKRHGLANLHDSDFVPKTWEEKIVFYADKRVKDDKVVSLEQRFEYIRQRYKREETEHEYKYAKEIEKEIFGDEVLN